VLHVTCYEKTENYEKTESMNYPRMSGLSVDSTDTVTEGVV